MRLLLVLALGLGVWVGPVQAQSTELPSSTANTFYSYVNMWANPITPGSSLDPWDPQLTQHMSGLLTFSYLDGPHPFSQEDSDRICHAGFAHLKKQGASENFHDVVIPPYGLGSKGLTGKTEQNVWDMICAYDTK